MTVRFFVVNVIKEEIMIDQHELYEKGYYNYWYDTTDKNGDKVRADAEFSPDEKLVSIVLYEYDDEGFVGDYIKEILPDKVSKPHLEWITMKWKKERVK
jgi:hypothetical protein